VVVYRSSEKGRGAIIMTELAALVPGQKYKIVGIDGDAYICVEGFEKSAGGGLHWSEFSAE
jgi:hypothetical protein